MSSSWWLGLSQLHLHISPHKKYSTFTCSGSWVNLHASEYVQELLDLAMRACQNFILSQLCSLNDVFFEVLRVAWYCVFNCISSKFLVPSWIRENSHVRCAVKLSHQTHTHGAIIDAVSTRMLSTSWANTPPMYSTESTVNENGVEIPAGFGRDKRVCETPQKAHTERH